MKAIRMHATGGPEVLALDEVDTPTPAAGEILIKIAAAGVNYADLMQRQGVYPPPHEPPLILGVEAAGTVTALGPGVSAPAIGDRVVAFVDGGYAEYAVAAAGQAVLIPDALGFPEATALLVQGLTAYGLLRDAARLGPDETVLVHAAAGGVGSLAVQVARLLGAGLVIGTAGADDKVARARDLGVDQALSYAADDWEARVRDVTGGRGADVILDAVGGVVGARSLALLAPFGRLVIFGAASGEPTPVVGQQLIPLNQTIIGYTLQGQPPDRRAAATATLLESVAAGRLRIDTGDTFPLAEAAAAHHAIAARRTTGKVALII